MFSKTRKVLRAFKTIPKLRRMYKALCVDCKVKLKDKLKSGCNNSADLLACLCEDCKKL